MESPPSVFSFPIASLNLLLPTERVAKPEKLLLGVNTTEYRLPEPVNAPKLPFVATISATVKPVTASLKVKVMVEVWLPFTEFTLLLSATVGRKVSMIKDTLLLAALAFPAASVNFPAATLKFPFSAVLVFGVKVA